MRQVGVIAAAGIYALDHHFHRLAEDHRNAKRLAAGIKGLRGISVNPESVETNIIIFDIAGIGMSSAHLAEGMKKEGVLIHALPNQKIRLVTHLDVSSEDVERALKAFKKILQ